ncbi:MAG TPA: PilN domain-containing protein [Mycobacteriales bacterium]|nr:PilN domain-containing protein [Mycobacteriales bacterium]
MTVLTSESTFLGTTTGRLPRVNLMPPEVAEARAMRRVQMGLGAAGLAAVAVVGLLYVSASHSVSSAESDLADSKTQTTALQGQVAKYKDVTATINAANAAQAQLVTAMGDEVRYSQLLNDLSLAVPSTVWLKNLSFASTAPTAAAPGAAPVSYNGALPIGTMTVSGIGFSHDDVALWLDAVAGLSKTFANPYFTNSTEALIGSRKTVNYQATAVVLSTAQSGRFKNTAGS